MLTEVHSLGPIYTRQTFTSPHVRFMQSEVRGEICNNRCESVFIGIAQALVSYNFSHPVIFTFGWLWVVKITIETFTSALYSETLYFYISISIFIIVNKFTYFFAHGESTFFRKFRGKMYMLNIEFIYMLSLTKMLGTETTRYYRGVAWHCIHVKRFVIS